ncbi:MAG: UDP-N-acetylmuramoyl-tripeptide--D-alanyl-D-alanine ligase [Bacteroidales bacterium]|nr:UDP-N-acetylmuramoyl-tripeptide--D-alanyl-D-alanine ligase [Bacteroidales bacterium]
MKIEELYQVYLQSRTVTTDSRQITPGCLFFAFKGETFDGNAFAPQALEQGAALCVISDPKYGADDRCVVVDDVLAALQGLARYHRGHLSIPIIGVTGTNGKTTTKELVHAVLARRYRTHATAGNYNNHLGVPLTLLATPADAEVAIIEMGANHPGEIAALCHIADPDCGLITNVGRAHLEGFGSFEGVIQTKTELYRYLAAKHGTAFVNADNDILTAEAARCQLATFTYGSSEQAQVRGHLVGSDPYMKFYIEEGDNVYSIQSRLLGNYNFDNAMAAAAVGRYLHVDLWDIKEAIEQYAPSNNRSQYKDTGRNSLILDCYNANPSSMKVALDNFEALPRANKVAMLGGMKELGEDSCKEHRAIVERLLAHPEIRAVLVGPEFAFAEGRPNVEWFSDSDAAVAYFAKHPLAGAMVLLKGSNSTRMWKLEGVL